MLELQNVSFKVEAESGEKEIIENVSLKISERFVALTGPNGGGKRLYLILPQKFSGWEMV